MCTFMISVMSFEDSFSFKRKCFIVATAVDSFKRPEVTIEVFLHQYEPQDTSVRPPTGSIYLLIIFPAQ